MDDRLKFKDESNNNYQKTYIIAEMSANHGQSKKRAKEIIYAAKDAGADCVKIQTYTPDTMTINSHKKYFKINNGLWKGEDLYNLYKKAYTPWEWQEELKREADKIGIDFFSTPYEKKSVDFLEEKVGIKFYKVASFSITNLPFLKYLASKNKPIIMSTGMATLGEIEEAVKTIKNAGNNNLALLKCTSSYPAKPEEMNIKTMSHLKNTFNLPVGLSDHSYGSFAPITAVALGASIIEKHFCLNRDIKTPDSEFSMEPKEFKKMVDEVRKAEKAIGDISYELSEGEKESRKIRRSIFVVKNIKKGEKFNENNIKIIRPGYGLKPKYFNKVLHKKASKNIERGTPLDWSLVG